MPCTRKDLCMKHLIAAVATLTAIVAGILVATSLSSSAQEDGDSDDTPTTTTVPGDADHGVFGFHFDGEFLEGDLPPELDELLTCLAGEGIEVPEAGDRPSRFELRGIEGLPEALEACGLPEFRGAFPFGGEFGENFRFGGEFPEDFSFGKPYSGEGFDFDFRFGRDLFDRDELATCLADLGSFDSVEEVRAQLDICLPELPDLDELDLEGFDGFLGRGRGGLGGWFGFDFEDPAPELEGASA